MSITIKRNTGLLGMGVNLAIKLNGEKVAKIGYEQEIELDIPGESAQLQVKQLGSKSNKLEVKAEDTIEITTPKWTYIILLLVVLSPTLLRAFVDSYMLVIVLVTVLAVSSLFFCRLL